MDFDLPLDATLREALDAAAQRLASLGIDTAREDASALLREAAGVSHAMLIAHSNDPLLSASRKTFIGFIARRLRREPVTRIIGRRGFWDLDLEVAEGVLDPRADSESVIAATLDHLAARRGEPLRILDIGSGSGALICALLREFPMAHGIAIDISTKACEATRRNAARSGVSERLQIACTSWDKCPEGPFDLVISNPPYIRSSEIPALDPEVRHWDPQIALDGGPDGLDAYRRLAAIGPGLLSANGWLILEIGHDQSRDVQSLLREAGFGRLHIHRDLGGHQRVMAGQRKG